MGRKLCLAIGVGDAPPLDYLRGAINGAHAMADWAKAQGYETTLLTDEKLPVDIGAIGAALDALLAGTEAERLLIYFAGHGLSKGAAEDLWLPSEWRDTQRAVSVAGLRMRLARCGVAQLSIFADACRMIATGDDERNLGGDAVLGRGRFAEQTPHTDIFPAASEARAAFMLPGRTAAESRCIFSGLLAEALAGAHPQAFDGAEKITNHSLADFLEQAVPAKAAQYGVTLQPRCTTGLRPPRNIYLDAPPPSPPPIAAWPKADAGRIAGMGADGTDRIAPPPGASWTTQNQAGAAILQEAGRLTSLPAIAAADRTAADQANKQAAQVAQAAIRAFKNEQRPGHFETGAGFSVHGADVKHALTDDRAIIEADMPGWWRVAGKESYQLQAPAPLLVQLSNGNWAAGMVVPGFITSFSIDENGVMAMILRAMGEPAPESERAMAQLLARGLQAEDAPTLAQQLHEQNHADPMLGVLAGYLHDAAGDRDNVRRTASYHARRDRMIPFDLALLGRLPVRREGELLIATVPAVEESPSRRNQPAYLFAATPAVEAPVAGACPLMRQGWALLDPEGDGDFYPPGLAEFSHRLLPAPFTTPDPVAGEMLAALLFRQVGTLDYA